MTSSRTPLAPLIYLGLFIIAAVITLVTAKETAIAGIFLWIATLPWNLWSLERSSKRSFRASSIIQLFRAF
jgi:hypothetical protein